VTCCNVVDVVVEVKVNTVKDGVEVQWHLIRRVGHPSRKDGRISRDYRCLRVGEGCGGRACCRIHRARFGGDRA